MSTNIPPMKKESPSMDAWIREAKQSENAKLCGMYLFHNGIVRETARARVRQGATDTKPVTGMYFSYDKDKVAAAVKEALTYDGIYYARVWLNEGELTVGDDIMYVLIGGDIRPRVIDGLNRLVGKIKNECVVEKEVY